MMFRRIRVSKKCERNLNNTGLNKVGLSEFVDKAVG